MLSKKGEEVGTSNTVGILLGIISFVVVATVLFFILGQGEVIENAMCKATVYFSDQTEGEGDFIPYLDVNPILCRTHYKELKDMEDLAGTMVNTWDIWGEGELDPSGTNWLKWAESKCFKQYRGEIFDDLIGVTQDQFRDFLEEKGDADDKTYWNYFNKKDFDNNRVILAFDVLNEGDFVAVVYFEEIRPSLLNPLWWGYFLVEFFEGDYKDFILVIKDNNDSPLDCVEIT